MNDHRERRPSRPQRGRPAPRKEGPRRPPEVDPARQAAFDVLAAVRTKDAYANLVLPTVLAGQRLAERDRALVTELVYGVTRMRRACDWLVDRFLHRPVDRHTRNVLRLGAYQLVFLGTPPHAAISTSVELGTQRSSMAPSASCTATCVNADALRANAGARPIGSPAT